MQKKLLALAVAGALALPGAALAASSVTINGFFKVSYASIKVSPQAAGAGRSTQDRVQDESSRIRFIVVEDLGGGLQAIGQVDWRMAIDSGADATSGANFVGLRSKSWGEITLGRHDLHYIYTEDQSYSRGGSLKMVNTSIIAYGNGGANAVANATRTPNVIRWFSPNWKGFTAVVAYSTNPYAAAEGDIASGTRKGSAWNIAPQYNAKNWGVGFSWYQGKSDGAIAQTVPVGVSVGGIGGTVGLAAPLEGTSWRVNGHYQWGGLRIGLVWDRSEWSDDNTVTGLVPTPTGVGIGNTYSKRDAWSIPIRYDWGKHSVFGHYSQAKNDKGSWYRNLSDLGLSNQSGADMWAIGYAYSLSKRTKVSLNYAKINNDAEGRYNLFTSAGGLGSGDAAVAPGQDPQQIAVTVTHSF